MTTTPADQLWAGADFFQVNHTYLRFVGDRHLYFRVLSISTDNPNGHDSLNGGGPVAFGWAHVDGPSTVWIPTGRTSFTGWRDVTDEQQLPEANEFTEDLAQLDAMRAAHPAPCRVPDSPDCTCAHYDRLHRTDRDEDS